MSGGTFGTNWLDYPINSANRYMRTYIQGFMDISGGNLIVRQNNLYLTQGDASINGNLILGYDASLNRRLFVGADASFGGKVFVTSDLSVNGTLSTSSIRSGSGTITLPTTTDTLATLTGTETLTNKTLTTPNISSIINSGTITLPTTTGTLATLTGTETLTNKTLTTSGLLTAGAGLTVTGDTTTSNRLFVTNDASLNGNAYIAKDLTVNGNLSVKQYSTNLTVYTVSYEFIVAQDMELNGRLFLSGDLSANSRLLLGGDASFNNRLYVGGSCNVNGSIIIGNGTTSNLTITPGYYYNGSSFTALANSMAFDLGGTGMVSFSDNVVFTGGNVGIGTTNPSYTLDITGNLRSTGTTYLTGGTASTTTGTGTLQVTGGAGITGNVNVGGIANVAGNIVISANTASTTTTTGALQVTGGVGIIGALNVGSDATYNSTINIKGSNVINFGSDQTKESNAGKIGYGTFSTGGSLDIVGAGTSSSNRQVKVWDMLSVAGNTTISGIASVTGNIITSATTASTSTTTGALQIGGGVGVAGNVCVGSNIFISSDGVQSIYITNTPGTSSGSSTYGRIFGTGGAIYLDYYGTLTFRNTSLTGALNNINTFVYANGQISATSFNATSDYRIKSDIQILDGSYNVDCLRPVTYINKGLNKRDIGFVANEVQEHYPFLVDGEKDDEKYQTLNYLGIIGILTKEIQDLKKENKEIKSRLDNLESKL